jgi:trans-AT polyketide synthase/acyltransferase/oxidoreductase domain-containing protein
VSPFNNDLPNLEKIIKAIAKKQRLSYKNEVRKMTTYVFPGQGSQRKGMGAGLFDEFKEITARADAVLGYSIKELCLHDPDNQLDQTQYTQPVLYIVNSLMYLKKIQEAPGKPDYVAGHSLGEYCALFTAGAFNFETGLRLVQKRGELMGRVAGGGMAAVIGLDEDKIIDILNDNALSSISIANCNSPLQIVISGIKEDLIKARKIFEQAGAELYIPLKVSGAFHSPHMARVRDEFEKFLAPYNFSQLTIRVISNVHARPYQQSDIKKTLVEQITSPVRWSETIQYLMGCGEMDFVEVGPGEVLTGLIKRIRAESAQRVETKEKVKPDVIENDPEQKKPHEVRIATTPTARDKSLEGRPTEEGAISVESLGCREYKKDYNLKYAYVAGGMYRGIASKEMVIKLGKAGMMGYLGTGGVSLAEIQDSINCIQKELVNGEAFGMNLLNTILEEPMVDLYLKNGIKNIEASAYIQVSPALVRYRLKGLSRGNDGNIVINHKIMAKVSRPDVAEEFLRPAPEKIVKKLLEEKKITDTEAELAMLVAMADDICAEADSGGHTDGGVAYALIPAVIRLRDEMMKKYKYKKKIRVGAAGGIGTPEAAAAAFILEADFILTGSINQCTVEAGTSDAVKDLLQDINVQDTAYAPAGDMFEVGSKVQVLKKGVFFPMRANRLYELYRQHNSLEEIDENTKRQLEEKYFKRSLKEIFEGLTKLYPPTEIENASKNGKRKMALVFKWYFSNATELALRGKTENIVDFQVMCGPALGAFNQWVKGTDLESWKNRNVDKIGIKIMNEAAAILSKKLLSLTT